MKKLLGLITAISLISTSTTSFYSINTNNKKENVILPEEKPNEQGENDVNNTKLIANDVINKIHSSAQKRTFKSFSEAQNEILNNKTKGTTISFENTLLSEGTIKNGMFNINIKLALEENFSWDNTSLENELTISTVISVDERTEIDDSQISSLFTPLSETIPATEEKVEHQRYYKTINNAIKTILKTQYNDGEILNVNIKDESIAHEVFINQEVTFLVEIILNEENKWNHSNQKELSTKQFEVTLKIDQRQEIKVGDIQQDIMAKIPLNEYNQRKFYSEKEALDAINNYSDISSLEVIKDKKISLQVESDSSILTNDPVYKKEYKIKATINDEKYKWSDETIESKTINLETIIDIRTEIKQADVEKKLSDALVNKKFNTEADLVNQVLQIETIDGSMITNVAVTQVNDDAKVTIQVILDAQHRWDDKDDNNLPKSFQIDSKIIDTRLSLSNVHKVLKTKFNEQKFKSTDEVKKFIEEIEIDGLLIKEVSITGNETEGWIIILELTPNEDYTWTDGTNKPTKVTLLGN
ncbi:hypothetical protein [Mesoplasma tabanidae]|uniref:Chitinase n=1 Tax=Mesoplasma tabanidae TaxID=219745 RepID=A0A2K8P7P2_9MOLU|nr:hypothetical protein [Mesoplasma tabanidae]ATZ21625.1 hypothetical protein MTABA_v1c04260 [Mesoplasma tabanidae]